LVFFFFSAHHSSSSSSKRDERERERQERERVRSLFFDESKAKKSPENQFAKHRNSLVKPQLEEKRRERERNFFSFFFWCVGTKQTTNENHESPFGYARFSSSGLFFLVLVLSKERRDLSEGKKKGKKHERVHTTRKKHSFSAL
jgi:hypothetical protein